MTVFLCLAAVNELGVIKMVVRRAVFIQSLIVVVYVLFNMQGNVVVSMKVIVYFYTCITRLPKTPLTRNTCIAEPREAWGGGRPIKCQGWKGERIGVKWVAWEGGFQHWL